MKPHKRAADSLEVLLESVPGHHLKALAAEIIGAGGITFASVSGCPDISAATLDRDFLGRLDACPSAMILRVDRVVLGSTTIDSPLIQALRHGDGLDVIVSWTEGALRGATGANPMPALHIAVLSLQRRFEIGGVMCGYEPASDPETRYFINEARGPMA